MSNQSAMWPQLKVKHTKSKALPGANPRAAGWLPAWIAESSGLGVSAVATSEDTNVVCKGSVLQCRKCLCLVNQ